MEQLQMDASFMQHATAYETQDNFEHHGTEHNGLTCDQISLLNSEVLMNCCQCLSLDNTERIMMC